MYRALLDLISVVDLACWAVCFYWMYRISSRQNATLRELHEQTKKIRALSKTEHDLIKEIHPKIDHIESNVDGLAREADVAKPERPS